jgi:putative methyltransferase (TIGR04325 family)
MKAPEWKAPLRRAYATLGPYLPGLVHRVINRATNPGAYTGDYATWDEARRASEGYDAGAIFEKARRAALKVKNGEARGERDSVVFDEAPYSHPVLAALLRAAMRHGGALHVVDFGGAFGSSYQQFLSYGVPLARLEWSIVEQPHFVACGRAEFEDGRLKFYGTVAECLQDRPRADVLLLSSVLTYLPDPYLFLDDFTGHGFRTIVVDRTLYVVGPRDRLCVQKVPPHIYDATYPAWLLSRPRFAAAMARAYDQVAVFENYDSYDFRRANATLLGFVFDRRAGG